MINEESDINLFTRLQKIITLFQRINKLSWTSDQARKRYPAPEAMSNEEVKALFRLYLALGLDIEEIYKEWKKIYNAYGESTK